MPKPELSRLEQALTPRLTRYIPHAPTPPQTAFLLLDVLEAFYGGAAGGGKSDALLMGALQYVDVPGYSALLLRRTFPELSQPGAIMARSHEWLGQWRKHGVTWNEQRKRWTFPGGATVTFGYLRSIRDVYQYQGAEFQFIGFDELTQFPEEPYTYLFSRLRRPDQGPLAMVPLRMRAASNPGNIGHGWVKKRLVVPKTRTATFIPAKLNDNPHLDQASYKESLRHLPELTQAQLLDGNWGAFEGAAFELTDDHLIDSFPLEDAMERFEAADYGLNGAPWCLWTVDYEGNVIAYDMLYEEQLLPSQLAPLVLRKRKTGWGHGHTAYMDPAVWHRTGTLNKWGQPAMLSDEFADNGVPIVKANPDPRAGLIRVREMLRLDPGHRFPNWHPRAGEPGAPRVYFVRSTTERMREELAAAPLQPVDKRDAGEIVDPAWESTYGHSVAQTRYALMTRPAPSVEPPPPVEDIRADFARRIAEQDPDDQPGYQI